LTLLGGNADALAQGKIPQDLPIMLSADQIIYNEDLEIVTATGNVEITQDQRVLLADSVSYNRKTNTVRASGNVSLLEPTGEVLFADSVELTDDLKEGIAYRIRMLLTDNSRLAAVAGRRTGGNRTDLRRGVFSPCKICEKHPDRPPLWRVRANRVIHDQVKHDIEYKDAFLDFAGIPVFYTPYLTHPDPTVKRRSGFLAPSYGSDSEIGVTIRVPYYFNIAPDKDATVAPIFTSKEGPVLTGQYRQRFSNGELEVGGSVFHGDRIENGVTREDRTRAHIKGKTRFDLDDTWRTGLDVDRVSDETYLRRFNFDSPTILESRAFLEGFRGRNYASTNAYAFQDLRSDADRATTPLILPMLDYNFVSQPGWRGSLWTLDANGMALHRDEGTESRRLSLAGGWQKEHISPGGSVYRIAATLRGDVYHVDDVRDRGDFDKTHDGFTGRIFPQGTIDWSFPMVRQGETASQLIEPMASLILAPNGGNPEEIPNEDSRDFELDDTNLFSANRFPGLDRVEGGRRINYGLKAGIYGLGTTGGSISGFIGQSYRFREDDTFLSGSGVEENQSDIVGRLQVSPAAWADILYRFRLDKDNFTSRRNELAFTLKPWKLTLTGNYIFVDELLGTGGFDDREQITVGAEAPITKYWSAFTSHQRDLTDGGGSLLTRFGLAYSDECFKFDASFTRRFTDDGETGPSDTLLFRLVFKHLGEVAFSPGIEGG
jgi:LPS-assembly protein